MEIQLIAPEHIERGITKYNGTRVASLEKLLIKVYTEPHVYLFNDGRILFTHTNSPFGILYKNEELFLQKIVLT